jgi:hypothetical protein
VAKRAFDRAQLAALLASGLSPGSAPGRLGRIDLKMFQPLQFGESRRLISMMVFGQMSDNQSTSA